MLQTIRSCSALSSFALLESALLPCVFLLISSEAETDAAEDEVTFSSVVDAQAVNSTANDNGIKLRTKYSFLL